LKKTYAIYFAYVSEAFLLRQASPFGMPSGGKHYP